MLIQFNIKNWRSIRDEQSLVLAKAKGSELLETNTFSTDDATDSKLLRSVVIYGANAAGKTNVIRAMSAMRDVVLKSGRGTNNLTQDPFYLDEDSFLNPTDLEVTIVVDGVKYLYGFSYDDAKIYSEWLIAYPNNRPQKWFTRELSDEDYIWSFGNALTGNKKIWKDSTRADSLFLSTAVSLNSKALEPIYNWFKDTLRISSVNGFNAHYSAKLCQDEKQKSKILNFLKSADLDIHDIEVETENFSAKHLPKSMPAEIKNHLLETAKDREMYSVNAVHLDSMKNRIQFPMNDESNGTQRIFELAGPWLDVLEKGKVLFFDELNDSLHPAIVRSLIGFFHSKDTNPKNAQLIFTTHDTSVLSQELFRRDQIWFCDKDKNQATSLYPLTDFSPRKGRENLEEAYLSGRYGALPYIHEFSFE